MPAQLGITASTTTAWQFGPIRASTDMRTDSEDEDKEQYLTTISATRFRDHENVTVVAEIVSGAEESIVGVTASFQGATATQVDGNSDFTPVEPAMYARWYLTDTVLEPIESQGSKFVRETQEWTTQTPTWTDGAWQ